VDTQRVVRTLRSIKHPPVMRWPTVCERGNAAQGSEHSHDNFESSGAYSRRLKSRVRFQCLTHEFNERRTRRLPRPRPVPMWLATVHGDVEQARHGEAWQCLAKPGSGRRDRLQGS
jgi:hypothetical protein